MEEVFEVFGGIASALIGILFWFFIIRLIFRNVRNKQNSVKKVTTSQKKVTQSAKPAAGQQRPAPAKKKTVVHDRSIQDTENDWLSQQLKEERRALREVSAMFELKQSHAGTCDAQKVKQEHEDRCAAEKLRKDSRK